MDISIGSCTTTRTFGGDWAELSTYSRRLTLIRTLGLVLVHPSSLSTMYKLLATAVFFAFSTQVALGALGAGETCVTIAGPTKEKCARGLNCCFVANDFSVCHKGECPTQYIPEGALCNELSKPLFAPTNLHPVGAGFAGPVEGECN
ncbi:hypothetical protein D9756_006621 [Leucocoprinus leucothites]|uniref:Uncharacterized protein n=1 Tax=Leucocoprinus leucothites TaxID=201217 RepID=A0A8H5LHE2_9AGAR|nr:hypothetical protein D9756_006621 [Leucoagaricus leucothites]